MCFFCPTIFQVKEKHQVSHNPTQRSQAVPEHMQTELSMALLDKAGGSDCLGSQTEPQCQCWKTPGETREAGTQTTELVPANTCNASTQCGLAGVSSAASICLESSPRPVVYRIQYSSTGGQRRHTFNSTLNTPLKDIFWSNSSGKIALQSFCEFKGAECDSSNCV